MSSAKATHINLINSTKCNVEQHDLLRDYRRTTSVSELISQLGWQSLEERRKSARVSLFYEGLHGMAAVPLYEFQHPTRYIRYYGTDTFRPTVVISD